MRCEAGFDLKEELHRCSCCGKPLMMDAIAALASWKLEVLESPIHTFVAFRVSGWRCVGQVFRNSTSR